MRISKTYLWLPLGLVPPVFNLWAGRYLTAALYSVFLLWIFHPNGHPNWRANFRAAGVMGAARRMTKFSKVLFGMAVLLTFLILFQSLGKI